MESTPTPTPTPTPDPSAVVADPALGSLAHAVEQLNHTLTVQGLVVATGFALVLAVLAWLAVSAER